MYDRQNSRESLTRNASDPRGDQDLTASVATLLSRASA